MQIQVSFGGAVGAPQSTLSPVRLFEIQYEEANQGVWQTYLRKIQVRNNWNFVFNVVKITIYFQARGEEADSRRAALTIEGLRPDTAYRFRVRAIIDTAESDYSEPSDWMRTAEDGSHIYF